MRRIAFLLPLLLFGAAPRAEFRLQELLPDTTLLFVETPSAAAFKAAFEKTPLAKFFEDEEVRAFLGPSLLGGLSDLMPVPGEKLDLEKGLKLVTGQVALALPAITRGEHREPDVVLSIDCGGAREELKRRVAQIRKLYEEKSGKKMEAWQAGGEEVLSAELDEHVHAHIAVFGDTAILTTWKDTMNLIAAGLRQAPAKPLSKSPAFATAREKSGAKELFFYADVAAFVARAKEELPEPGRKFVAALGVEGFTTAAGGLAIGDGAVRERFFLGTSGERKGLAKFLSLKGPAAGFEAAPVDALQFASFSVELSELYDTLFEVLKSADEFQQQKMKDELADFEKEVGFSIRNDLFPAFGPRVWWYSALPPDGLIPDGLAGLEIRDAARFDKCLQAVLQRLPAELGQMDFQGKKIQYFKLGAPGGFEPGRALLSTIYFHRDGDKITLSSLIGGFGAANALKRHFLRQGKPSLATHPAVKAWTDGKQTASAVVYVDLARTFTTYYNTLAPLATLFREMALTEQGGVDLLKLPLGETIGKYLGQSLHQVSVGEDGLRLEGVSASGTTLMTAVYVGAAAAVILPAVARATEDTKLSGCRANASSVYFAVLGYKDTAKKFPEQTGAEFFKEMVTEGLDANMVCPVSGLAYRGPAKDMNTLADEDVIFCDAPNGHKDGSIHVLRRNGTMATLKPADPEYARALQTTK